MADNERKHIEKVEVNLSQKVKGEFTYWKQWQWNQEQPLVMVLANYPVTGSIMTDDLTSILIRNTIVERGTFGGVVIANLFNAPVKWPGNKRLKVAAASDGIAELVTMTKGVKQVIIATGTLTTKYEVATQRLNDYISQCQAINQLNKLVWLLNDGGRRMHPLALRNTPWEFGPVGSVTKQESASQVVAHE